jgi:NADPH2:quinone reductase
MDEPRNRVVQVRRFGDPDALEVADAPLPMAGRGEVRVRVLASSVQYTDVLIRRRLYPQTMRLRLPFVIGYDVVGEIDQLGDGVSGFQVGDRVADMTVVGSNAAYRTLRAGQTSYAHRVDVDSAVVSMEVVAWWQACPLLLDQRDASATSLLVPGGPGAALRAVGNARNPAPRRRADLLR